MLEDDRFLLHAGGFWKGFIKRSADLFALLLSAWVALADIVGPHIDGAQLRSSALHCSFVSIGYMWMTTYKATTELPLSLTQGSIEDNLEVLRRKAVAGRRRRQENSAPHGGRSLSPGHRAGGALDARCSLPDRVGGEGARCRRVDQAAPREVLDRSHRHPQLAGPDRTFVQQAPRRAEDGGLGAQAHRLDKQVGIRPPEGALRGPTLV